MKAFMYPDAHSGMDSRSPARSLLCTLPCSRACMHSFTQSAMGSGTKSDTKSSARLARCPQGFSEVQIAILSVLKGHPHVIAYWQLAAIINSCYGISVTEGVARGALERLYPRGYLVRNRAANGKAQGNRYAFAADPCPHITPYLQGKESGTGSDMETSGSEPSSILLEKIDRKKLSISFEEDDDNAHSARLLEKLSEDDLAHHWPSLSKVGFGTFQIRQILERLAQASISTKNVLQGLTHAEWELANNKMQDKTGAAIISPVNWVFKILATQGYYPRPEGYVSPQEQAELDAVEEYKRHTTAREIRQNMALESWKSALSSEEHASITVPKNGGSKIPEDIALRLYFKKYVWPKLMFEMINNDVGKTPLDIK